VKRREPGLASPAPDHIAPSTRRDLTVSGGWPNRRECWSWAADVAEARAKLRRRRQLLAALEVELDQPETWPTDPKAVAV
jgi:hypothetical protein